MNIDYSKNFKPIRKWFILPEKLRFLVIAVSNTIFRYGVFIVLFYLGDEKYGQAALLAAWLMSSFTAFAGLKYLVFVTKGNHLKEYMKSVVTLIIGYLFNVMLYWFFVNIIGLPAVLGQGIALGLVLISNYFLFRHFAFKQ